MIEYIDKWLFNVIKIIVVLALTLFVLNQVGIWMENKSSSSREGQPLAVPCQQGERK